MNMYGTNPATREGIYTSLASVGHQDGLAGGGGGDAGGLGLVFRQISKTSAGVTGSLVSSTVASPSLS